MLRKPSKQGVEVAVSERRTAGSGGEYHNRQLNRLDRRDAVWIYVSAEADVIVIDFLTWHWRLAWQVTFRV